MDADSKDYIDTRLQLLKSDLGSRIDLVEKDRENACIRTEHSFEGLETTIQHLGDMVKKLDERLKTVEIKDTQAKVATVDKTKGWILKIIGTAVGGYILVNLQKIIEFINGVVSGSIKGGNP
jgi:hypothetical protein